MREMRSSSHQQGEGFRELGRYFLCCFLIKDALDLVVDCLACGCAEFSSLSKLFVAYERWNFGEGGGFEAQIGALFGGDLGGVIYVKEEIE